MFRYNAFFTVFALSVILIISSLNFHSLNIPVNGQTTESPISQQEYDKIKNCTTDTSKKPTPVEYLVHFNCGHVSKDVTGKTLRQFTLIVDEDQKIPLTYEGHIFEGWTFNSTIPGPTIRVTEGDLVRIRVINSNDNTNAHSFYAQPINLGKDNAFTKTGQPGGIISPGRSFTYEFVAEPFGVYPYYCHVEPMADHINRGLYGMMIIDPKEPRPQKEEMAMLLNGYDLDLDLEGPTKIPPAALFQTIEDSNMTEDMTENETSTEANMTEDMTENETSTEANTTLVSSDMESAD